MASKKPSITEEEKIAAEEQIRALRKEIDYNTRDYSIDFLIQQFRNDEFYIPDEYQRQYIWNNADKNRFIESILLGLPIPLMFFSDTEDGRCEIIDGAQRTQAMEEFMSGDLVLSDLKKLTSLNGFSYNDVPAYFRKKFDAPRPYTVYNYEPIIKKEKEGNSFPSRHVFSAFVIATTFIYANLELGICLFAISCLIAVLRVIGGVHFPKDVIVGAITGSICGVLGSLLFIAIR